MATKTKTQRFAVGDTVKYFRDPYGHPDLREACGCPYTVEAVESDGYVIIRSCLSKQEWRASAWRLVRVSA